MISALRVFWTEEDGEDLVEYSLLVAFVALAAVALLGKGSLFEMWSTIRSTVTGAKSPSRP